MHFKISEIQRKLQLVLNRNRERDLRRTARYAQRRHESAEDIDSPLSAFKALFVLLDDTSSHLYILCDQIFLKPATNQ